MLAGCFLVIPALPAAEIAVRDNFTGRGLAAELEFVELDAPVAPVSSSLKRLLDTAPEYRRGHMQLDRRASWVSDSYVALRASADGYASLWTVLRPAPENRGWTLWLDPLAATAPVPKDVHHWLEGYVNDARTLRPVADAVVRMEAPELEVRTANDGYFLLPLPDAVVEVTGPVVAEVSVRATGLPRWRGEILLAPGGTHRLIDLGAAERESAGHRHRAGAETRQEPSDQARLVFASKGDIEDAPPASITVGFADAGCTTRCCTGDCPHACTFSLEEYVRRGLPKEWIASWQQHSLRAGAVAYRSYGAWHVFNPPALSAYDLCSSACCQVNEPGTHANTNQAVATTPGILLARDGGVFRSEYSAENNSLLGDMACSNNDLSCGNGFAGSPAADWPCLDDPVGLDQACFGHGRGMSQWGTQRWSLTPHHRSWKWQLDHYYNDHGAGSGLRTATISRVMVIDALRVEPAAASPGDTITLELDVRNLASETHAAVLIGASLSMAGTGFVDDPDNDQPVTLSPGQATVSRSFLLPEKLVLGSYDVHAALWIDIDGDENITSEDLVQHLVVEPQTLVIVEAEDEVFDDRFELP